MKPLKHAPSKGNDRADRINSRLHKIDWQYWPDTSAQLNSIDGPVIQLSSISRPDIEDESLISWGLAQSAKRKGVDATVDVLYGEGTTLHWKRDVDEKELDSILQKPEPASGRSLRMCFLNTLQAESSWLPGNFNIRPETLHVLRKAGLSAVILSNIFSEHGYWSKMGNQSSLCYDDSGDLKSFEMCYQYRCGWDTGVSFTQLSRRQKQSTYFCINFPSCAFERLERAVKTNPALIHRDFFPDVLIADDSLKQWQYEIGHRRDSLGLYEKQYEDERIDFNSATIQLHRLSRHWLTLGQDMMDFHMQLNFLHDAYLQYKKNLRAQTPSWTFDKAVDMGESISMLKSQCDICLRWTRAYHERTNIRINLLFHLANQRESRTNTQIASSTAKVAEQTQRDSSSMITIAAVTMIFLPGTFVSAILSTTFFDYGDEGLHVSSKWWVLLAATIPLTIAVFGIWLGWRYVRLQKQMRENENEKERERKQVG